MKKVGIIANMHKANVVEVSKKLIDFFGAHGIKVFLEKDLSAKIRRNKIEVLSSVRIKEMDIVISLGGDGTFLRVARVVHDKPILGVNLGDLGFLAEITLPNLIKDLKQLIEGKYKIEQRMTLDTEVVKKGKRKKVCSALNDIAVSKSEICRVIDLSIFIDKQYVAKFKADGVVISTPTGSTAYNLSVGGPIVLPGSEIIIISPICPHMLTHRPLVVPSQSKIEIVCDAPEKGVELTIDGQVGLEIVKNDKIIITKSKNKVPVILLRNNAYFEVLRQKLLWGKR